jgi:hypothetical protein
LEGLYDGFVAAEFANGFFFDLADALAGESQLLGNFFQGHWISLVDSEVHAQDLGFSLL